MFRFDAVPSTPSGGTPDTVDYNTQVQNKPQIEGTTLSGNKTLAQLKIQGILSTENPLKLTDNKIILQTDSQLLQVNPAGELTVNLDEVGSELMGKLNSDVDNITDTGKQAIKDIVGTIPSKTSQLTNDSNFITNTTDSLTNYTKTSELSTVATSGSYNDLEDKPTIPTVPSNITTQGNTFNGNNQLVQLDGTGKLPAVDGSLLTNVSATLPTASTTVLGGVKVDGTSITISDGVISATIGGSTATEKYGIQSDYATRYGILECPNGIFSYSGTGKDVVLKQGVVLQCAGQNEKTTIANDMPYSITSEGEIDLFYAGGEILECGDVFYQTTEPQDGVSNYLAWWNPEVGKWQFKSNDTGNVFREAVACRLAHVHVNSTGITRIDYIGNRILDDEIFALQSDIPTKTSELQNDSNFLTSIPDTVQLKTDNSLNTEAKTIVGAINELLTKINSLQTQAEAVSTELDNINGEEV
jgi:hypothetical protein